MQLIIQPSHWEFNTIEIIRVIDGDTYLLRTLVDTGFYNYNASTAEIRLKDMDCPESRSLNAAEKQHGLEATSFVTQLFNTVGVGKLHTFKTGRSFTRWIGDIWLKDGRFLADVIRQSGFEKRSSY